MCVRIEFLLKAAHSGNVTSRLWDSGSAHLGVTDLPNAADNHFVLLSFAQLFKNNREDPGVTSYYSK